MRSAEQPSACMPKCPEKLSTLRLTVTLAALVSWMLRLSQRLTLKPVIVIHDCPGT